MPPEIIAELDAKELNRPNSTPWKRFFPETDVLYVTRVQKERFADLADYEKVAGAYIIDRRS